MNVWHARVCGRMTNTSQWVVVAHVARAPLNTPCVRHFKQHSHPTMKMHTSRAHHTIHLSISASGAPHAHTHACGVHTPPHGCHHTLPVTPHGWGTQGRRTWPPYLAATPTLTHTSESIRHPHRSGEPTARAAAQSS